MVKSFRLWLYCILSFSLAFGRTSIPEFTVIIPSFNNAPRVKWNLQSVIAQDYRQFDVLYINDCSTDATGRFVDEFVKANQLERKIIVIHNPTRKGALCNLYTHINQLPDHKIVVCLDGDDAFHSPTALSRIAQEYQDDTVWMTYGNYNRMSGIASICGPLPKRVIERNAFRKSPWKTSHVKTFYAALFKLIKKEDLCFRGEFFSIASDLAIMYPMLEMASKGHIRFIPDILYDYNDLHELNDHKVQSESQQRMKRFIQAQRPYEPLEKLPFVLK